MAATSFDNQFLYVATGWEGSAADMRVLKWALQEGGFKVPQGKYFLVDSRYANTDSFLAPYRGMRYHIGEYNAGQAYTSPEDRYNHRHAQLRNCVEKTFGILKMRFAILRTATRYPIRWQGPIVMACCILHNFIRRTNGNDEYFTRTILDEQSDDADGLDEDPTTYVGPLESQLGDVLRNSVRDGLQGGVQ